MELDKGYSKPATTGNQAWEVMEYRWLEPNLLHIHKQSYFSLVNVSSMSWLSLQICIAAYHIVVIFSILILLFFQFQLPVR
jgi:hypothetical protein